MTKVVNPQPLFIDGRGFLLDGGYVYIGAANTNPETRPTGCNCFGTTR
jgi:hypothetical protein